VVGCRPDTVSQPKLESVLPVMVLTKGFGASDVVVAGAEDNVEGAIAMADDPIPTKLDSEKGEHPTKPGAVSPTDAHSCWLNRIASIDGSALAYEWKTA
jgi:hypothetical protein